MDAVGPLSTAEDIGCQHLASCASFQAFLGVSSKAAALAKTFNAALPPPTDGKEYTADEWEESLRPYGMVYASTAAGYSVRRSAGYARSESGRMYIEFEITIPTDYQPAPEDTPIDLTTELNAADRWIKNNIGQIIAEFMDKGGQPGFLDVSRVTLMMGPSREEPNETQTHGCYYWTMLEVAWGEES